MLRRLGFLLLAFVAGCADGGVAASSATTVAATTVTTQPVTTTSTTIGAATTTASLPPPSTTTTTTIAGTPVTASGTYPDAELAIHLRVVSEIVDVRSRDLEAIVMAVLNDGRGWVNSGFRFAADPDSELTLVLAEGSKVDELCLPLETRGEVSCQNGSVVALNADRWRRGFPEWDGTIDAYRFYLITHEVGHLIGLRHPLDRCPTSEKIAAVMEPQTNNMEDCIGNGIPLPWELELAATRPAVVGPLPDWDGPQPSWPDDG